ncbi:MAG: MarR family transcriptional regulator [Thermoplasmatota archaeon]
MAVNAADLQLLGASRVEALLVLHLLEHPTTSTSDIIDATGLRQPEVSVGMRELRERGWVRTKPIAREGKGRPMHGYQLARPPGDVLHHYVAEGRRHMKQYEAAVQAVEAVS